MPARTANRDDHGGHFVVALAVPRLTSRFGNGRLLTGSLLLAVIGITWLGRVSADTSYLTAVALPMLLVGRPEGRSPR